MKRPDRRPCLCGCQTLVRRPRSLPLCADASARLRAITRAMVRRMDVNEYQAAYSRLMGDEGAVRATLAAS